MKPSKIATNICSNGLLLILFGTAFTPLSATGQPGVFSEDFSGPTLDPAWTQEGNLASHPAAIAGTYDMTHINSDPAGGTKLKRSTSGTLTSFVQVVELVLDPFGQTGGGGTQTDFKLKNAGTEGYLEIVLNSFGEMRLWHNDFSGGADNIQPNTNIGYSDGDLLKLTTVYHLGSDTVGVSYTLNGGSNIPFYSGGGLNGPLGDTITDFVQANVFKWGSSVAQPLVSIDNWSLSAVPEPTSAVLMMVASISLLGRGRRRV